MKRQVAVEVLGPEKKRPGPQSKTLNATQIEELRALRAQGLAWDEVAVQTNRSHHTLRKAAEAAGITVGKPGRPMTIVDRRELTSVTAPEIPPLLAIESLLIFDARCLDEETRQDLLRLLPGLVHIRHAWQAQYMECGCVSCHKKKGEYGAGGFCNTCYRRVYMRMRNRFRKAMEGRDLTAEVETFKDALALRYNEAQRLFNSDEE